MTQMIPYKRSAVDASNAISEGMNFPGFNYWLFFGISLIIWLILTFLSFIPFLGIIAYAILFGPFFVGLYSVILKKYDDEFADFSMMFSGFSKFVPAMVVSLIHLSPYILFNFIYLIMNFAFLFADLTNTGNSFQAGSPPPDFNSFFTGPLIALFIGVIIVSLLFALALYITFFSAYALLAEHKISGIEAIKLSAKSGWSNFGGLTALAIFQLLITFAGSLLCGIGVFFVLPIIYGSSVVAYRNMFPKVQTADQYDTPPQPNEYADMMS